jgi:hypothetical protein
MSAHNQSTNHAGTPAITLQRFNDLLSALQRMQQLELSLLMQGEAELRQIILAIRPLSPEALAQHLWTTRLSKDTLLAALRESCDALNVACVAYQEGQLQEGERFVQGCRTILHRITTTR